MSIDDILIKILNYYLKWRSYWKKPISERISI